MKYKFISRFIVLSVLLALLFGTSGINPARAEMITFSTDFSSLTGWKVLGDAKLETGWLRLTPNQNNKTGVAFYNTAYATAGRAFDIEFDYAAYGGNGADGLTFFMLDGGATPTATGGASKDLGYKGINGGLFAVGLDEYGNFGGQNVAPPAYGQDNVAIQGATSMQNTLLISVLTPIETGSQGGHKHVRITFVNNQVSVWINGNLLIDQQALTSPLPSTVKFGFSGATGSYNNIHEVDNLKIYMTPLVLHAKADGYTDWPCGQEWITACGLQTALTHAAPGQEIWVKAGVYKPTDGIDRTATFQLVPGVAVYGGFSGDETTRNERHTDLYDETILSGFMYADIWENVYSYHVVSGADNATLDGFTITGGNANGVSPNDRGGGMINNGTSPTVTNVTFSDNLAVYGGGMVNNDGSNPTLTNVTFSGNSAASLGGGMFNAASSPTLTNVTFSGNSAGSGGGMINDSGSSPTIKNATFSANEATDAGGGMSNYRSSPSVTNVTFSSNKATRGGATGGGMYNSQSSPTVTNATFSSNSADYGGGIYSSGGNLTVTNVTFSGNSASSGGGMYNYGSSTLTNVILWGDTGGEIYGGGTVRYSVVQGGYSGGTNIITTDPKLGPLGDYGGFTQTIPLLFGSSAIDKGNNLYCAYAPVSNLDQRGIKRPQDGDKDGVTGCDIGAFERDRALVYYVKPNASGISCNSWQDACGLQKALSDAPEGSEIWVMTGTYQPTSGTDRAASFQLKDGVQVYGGFNGTETDRIQRNPAVNATTLSGDLKGNDNAIESTRSDNSYHVVSGATGATLDGFTISGGNANGSGELANGGGLYNHAASPMLSNLIFEGNSAASSGAGMYNTNGSEPTITRVIFANNKSNGNGGGLANNFSSPTITDVTFSGNSASNGGGLYNSSSNPSVANVTFNSNKATESGGGMYNNQSSPSVTNITFNGNEATVNGGGMYNNNASNPTVTNITFSGNKATANGGGGLYNQASTPTLKNVILWGDTGGEIGGAAATVNSSVVQGGYSGTGNLATDPKLGTLGSYGGFTQTLPLLAGSSAVNAGENNVCPPKDQNGVTRPSGGTCDIGAFELDLKKLETDARTKLKAAMELRLALSPYRANNDFDSIVAKFDYAAGLNRSYQGASLQAQIAQADADLRVARNLYGFLISYNADFRGDAFYTGNPPAGYSEPLCGASGSKEDGNPEDPSHSGQVLDPVIDWCDWPARLRQSVREGAYMHMIFGQQFMADAMGLQFSGTSLLGADAAVRQEAARLDAARYQYVQAEKMLNEALDSPVGNGCYVSDYFTQSEWSLFSRAIEGQETAQHQLGVRLSYLDVPQQPTGPQQRRDVGVETLRVAASDGYVKMIAMAAGQPSGSTCVIDGAKRPESGLAAEMAINLAKTRSTANEMSAGRNIFGFDVTFTPARRYTGGACGTESAGLYQDAVCAAQLAQQLQDAEAAAERDYNNSQVALRAEVQAIQNGIDAQISEKSGCDAEDWDCVSEQKAYLDECLAVVNVYPATATQNFDACINKTVINNSTAKQALLDLRSIYIQQYSITVKAKNINERVKLSNDANATVTTWLGVSGGAETAARITQSAFDTISCYEGGTVEIVGKLTHNLGCSIFGFTNVGVQALAGTMSTAANIEIENANNYKETQNLLLDQQELLIDAYGAYQQFAAKYSEYQGLLDSLDDDVLEAQRQRAYFASSPANDPGYRIVLDSTRLQFASQLDLASKLTYLAARRAEYEYGARLNASNIRISDIYRARTATDLLTFLSRLNSVTNNLPAGIPANLSARDLTYSVAQNLVPSDQTFSQWVTDHTQNGVLKFTLSTNLQEGGSINQLIPQGFDGYWLITMGGIGSPKSTSNGLSVNLVSQQTGLGYRAVRVSQGGTVQLKSQAGCIFDYQLIAPAFLLGLDWPTNQDQGTATASFLANVNQETPYTNNGMRTEAFQGRGLASTDWTVEIFLGPPAQGMGNMDLSKLTDIQLNFSIVYASRTPGEPTPSACTRIDW